MQALFAILTIPPCALTQTAKEISVALEYIDVRDLSELEPAIERARSQFDAIVVLDDGLFVANRTRIAELAIKNRLPSIGFGLMASIFHKSGVVQGR